jgi:hypothetical protein
MAGTIVVSKKSSRDLRTIDFAWLADQLRAKRGDLEAALAKVLEFHDQGGIDILNADGLDEKQFKLFARAVREIHEDLAAHSANDGMTIFLASLLREIEMDQRYQ